MDQKPKTAAKGPVLMYRCLVLLFPLRPNIAFLGIGIHVDVAG